MVNRIVARPGAFFFYMICCVMLTGCQQGAMTATRPSRAIADAERVDAAYLLGRYIDLDKELEECCESEYPMQPADVLDRMKWIKVNIARCAGYDFESNYTLWDSWRKWLENRDPGVIHEILREL